MLKRSTDSSDSGLRNQFPKRLKTLASNVTLSEGNNLLHQFVLDNSSPNDSGSENQENYINAVLLSMCDTSVNARNNEGFCAIHLAVLNNNILMVSKMLSCFKTLEVNMKDEDKNTALHLATKAGYVLIMQALLNNGADVNAQGQYSKTPLHLAVELGNLNIIKLLLERGANVDSKDKDKSTALHLATKAGHVLIMQELLNHGADVDAIQSCDRYSSNTPLHLALKRDNLNLSTITLLLERGADVNSRDGDFITALHLAAEAGHVPIMQELLNNGAYVNAQCCLKRTPLHVALQRDNLNLDIITLLLERGTNVNAPGGFYNRTPLHFALGRRNLNLEIITLLLKRGAYVNAQDKGGNTALHLATKAGSVLIGAIKQTKRLAIRRNNLNLDIITLLLKRGANVNAQNEDKETALHFATEAGHVLIMQELLNNGADVNAQGGDFGRTPLHMALKTDNLNLDIITLLLERGTNVNAQDKKNDTALHFATEAGHVLIMQELLNNGANVNAQGYLGRTPLHVALQRGNLNLDITTLLLERGANVNAQDKNNDTALHIATKAGHVLIMQ